MFNKQNFCHVASNNRNEQKAGLFLYKTTDDLDTVTTSGYFNDKIIDINLHDLIIHEWHDPSDKTKVQQNLLCVIERTLDNVGTTVIKSKWEGVVDEFMEHGLGTDFVKLDGTSVMTGPLKMANGSMRGAFSPYLNGVGFFKMDAQGVLTQISTLSDTQFLPATTSAIDLGSNTKKWKNLYLTAYEYIDNTDNNGQSLRFVNYVSGTSTIMGIERYSSSYPQAFIHFNTNPERIEIQGHSGSTGDGILCISGSGGWLENSGTSRYWGNVSYPWDVIYTTKLNNGADVVVPNQAGTMVVADYTDAAEGQVLTLDSSLNPVWGTLSGSVNLTEPSTVVVPADAESDQIINKNYVDSLIQAIVSQIGGNQILQIQTPTAQNNYTWYRLYADGWVEQGGIYTSEIIAGSSASVTLPITMADTNYACFITAEQNSSNWSGASLKDGSKSTTGFQIYAIGSTSGDKIKGASWEVKGMADTATKYIYTVPGTYTLTLEPGTYEFDMSGAGGGGAAALGTSLSGHTAGASGGTGSYGSFTLTVAQTDTFTITVGASGAGATKSKGTAQGGAGGATTISSTDLGDFVSLGGGGGGYAHATSNGDTAIKGTRGTFTTTLTTHSLNNGVQGGSSSTASGSASYGNTTNPLPYDGYGFGGGWMYDMGATQMSASNGGNGFVIITKQ